MTDKSQDIISLINQYTSELEELDQLSITYIMTCIGVIGVILGIIATIYINNKKNNWQSTSYRIVAPLFLTIPVIISIFLGAVTLNCRKVAIYRGYLVYLEQSYNKLSGTIPQNYNTRVLQYLSKWGPSNPNGSVTNYLVDYAYLILIAVCFVVCFYCAAKAFNKSDKAKRYGKKMKTLFKISYILIVLVCLAIYAACIIDLGIQSVSIEKVLSMASV